jgi:magnesium-transporting ATPase (P-type)
MIQALPAETERTTYESDLLGRDIQLISDRQLLPGRKFKVTENITLPCDAVLICGKVVMDESMLTGESVPVSKVPLDSSEIEGDKSYVLSLDRLSLKSRKLKNSQKQAKRNQRNHMSNQEADEEDNKTEDRDLEDTFIENTALQQPNLIADNELAIKRSGSILFGGTRVKACYGSECIAVVYRTGFRSAKGMLVASLLKPKEGFINFVSDALWVLLFMVILSTVMYFAVTVRIVELGANAVAVFYHYLDTITIAVPPALTACLTVATAISIGRLKKLSIFVSDTSRVNFAGVVNAVCFDKTGTLTEDKLTFVGYQTPVISSRTGVSMDEWMDFSKDNGQILPLRCQEIMATCHALSLFGFDNNLTPVGDPMEVELLTASGWDLRASKSVPGQLVACPPMEHIVLDGEISPDEEYTILKHFEFTPDRLRAASIVQEPSGHLVYLMKGSPEVIIKLCSASTVPHSIHQTMTKLTKRGFRVIAVAYRDLRTKSVEAVQALTQDECEIEHPNGQQFTVFAGLLYLSNELKGDSRRTIRALHNANLHTNMITGDHVFTAISVAKQCHILYPDMPAVHNADSLSNQQDSKTARRHKNDKDYNKNQNDPVIIKPAEETARSSLMTLSNPETARYVLIIEENETIRGELCIKDYDSGLLVDIDLFRCAAMASKTIYRTIMNRYHQKQVSSRRSELSGKRVEGNHFFFKNGKSNGTDSRKLQQDTKAVKSKGQDKIDRSKSNAADAVTNPLLLHSESVTPFSEGHKGESATISSLNSSKMDISLMSFSNFAMAGTETVSSSTYNLNTSNNALNTSVHSVRSTTSNKSANSGPHNPLHHHVPTQPFRLLYHHRNSQSLQPVGAMPNHSPTSSHHSVLSLRQVAPSSTVHDHCHSSSRPDSPISLLQYHKPVLLHIPKGAHVELAITGKALHLIRDQYSYTLYQKLIRYARVFARMKPHDKREVVETMSETLEYKNRDMSLKHCENLEGDEPSSFELPNKSSRVLTNSISVKSPIFLSSSTVPAPNHDQELGEIDHSAIVGADHSFISMESGSLLDHDNTSDDDVEDSHHPPFHLKASGIAGTMQDRRRRKASMLTSIVKVGHHESHEGILSGVENLPVITSLEQKHQAEENDEHSAALMLFPTPPHSHFEQDLEAQDYPPISHPNYHHPHGPAMHEQLTRSREHSVSTITTQRSLQSHQIVAKSESKASKSPQNSAASSGSVWFSRVFEYITDNLAGTPPVAEPLEVLFCGDGANDMIALRAATVGISLCDAETSVAAPITSRQATPYSVLQVLREGRCSLITAYVLILFNIMYGTIQLFMVCALYFYGLIPGNYMYLQQDLGYTLVLGLAISYSLPAQSLNNLMPPKRFLSRRFLVQLGLLLISFVLFQLISLWVLSLQTFYTPYKATTAFTETYSFEASTTQAMALGQLMLASIASSLGEPFRLSWHLNAYHLYALLVQGIWLLFQIFAQNNYLLQEILQIKPFPVYFGMIIVGLLILNGLMAMWIVQYVERHIAPMTSKRWFEVCAMKQLQLRKQRKARESLQFPQNSRKFGDLLGGTYSDTKGNTTAAKIEVASRKKKRKKQGSRLTRLDQDDEDCHNDNKHNDRVTLLPK